MWAAADTTSPSLHMTSVVLGIAHRVARHDRAVAAHPWLRRATDWAMAEIAALDGPRDAIEFRFVLQLLDALEATDELERLAAHLPPDGTMAVSGGKPDEAMRPLDFSPGPGRPLRALLDPRAIDADLDRLEAEQHDDGGWDVDLGALVTRRRARVARLGYRARAADPAGEPPPVNAAPPPARTRRARPAGHAHWNPSARAD